MKAISKKSLVKGHICDYFLFNKTNFITLNALASNSKRFFTSINSINSNSKSKTSDNIRQNFTEFEKDNAKVFESLNDWWNPNGSLKTLHSYNTLRLEFINSILNELNTDLKGKKCLDIGCGGGLLSESLCRLKGQVTGIDPNITSYETATNHLNVYEGEEKVMMKKGLTYKNCFLEELSKKEKFDYVFCFEVIEHIESMEGKEKFISEIKDRINDGGILFMSTIGKNALSKLLMLDFAENLVGIVPKGTHSYESFIESEDLSYLLEKQSFKILDLQGVSYNPITENMSLIDFKKVNYILAASKI